MLQFALASPRPQLPHPEQNSTFLSSSKTPISIPLSIRHRDTCSSHYLDRIDVIEQHFIQTRVHRRVKMQHVPIQMRVLRHVQMCVHRPGGKGDGSGVQDAETFALGVVLEVVFGLERSRFPVGLSGWWEVGWE